MTDVFQALADPTRRAILDRLREEDLLSVSELSARLPMSRQAATKHLDILVSAGLVELVWRGRERRHRLTAPPLEEIERWLEPYAQAWDRRLERLRTFLDEPEEEDGESSAVELASTQEKQS